MKPRIAVPGGVVLIVAASFFSFFFRASSHKMLLRAYFSDARDVRSGAEVRLAGVKVGTVKGVRIQPSRKEAPAELTMALDTQYDLQIPDDSIVVLQTAGVVGETYAEIEIAGTSGPPIRTNGVIRSELVKQASLGQVVEGLMSALKKCSDGQSTKENAVPSKTGPGRTNSPLR